VDSSRSNKKKKNELKPNTERLFHRNRWHWYECFGSVFKNIGKRVSGYDKTPTTLTRELIDSGIAIHFEDNIDLIPKDYFVENTLVIITPAVPNGH
jgi:hypothetical protein